MEDTHEGRVIGLVGERGSGKTSLILDLIQYIQKKPFALTGVISPGIFEGDQKVAIELIDLCSWEGRLLARLTDEEETGLQFGDWSFFEETLAWGNHKLQNCPPSDILILDEIGPLELDLDQGLQSGLARLSKEQYRLGIISLRPRCAEGVQQHFPDIQLLYLGSLGVEVVKEMVFRIVEDLV